jgi:hypothetical protein
MSGYSALMRRNCRIIGVCSLSKALILWRRSLVHHP